MNALLLTLLFNTTSAQFNLPEGLLSSICYVESTHNVNAIHKNDGVGNSVGICQIKISSARDVGFKGTEQQLQEPKTNIKYAGKFLAYQIKRYRGKIPRAVTAYNKGRSTGTGYSVYYDKVNRVWSKHGSTNIACTAYP